MGGYGALSAGWVVRGEMDTGCEWGNRLLQATASDWHGKNDFNDAPYLPITHNGR
ncbi:hypothetical protein KUIN1_01880 [Pseudomonas sp. KUIN-1]|nr:hypothetical protein KUIN1_01880 [Pseudomonas sp. KUIN-1]